MISNLCSILRFLDTLELKEEKWKEITDLFCFLFFFFFPSLFVIFLSSCTSQCVVFKKQGLINEVSEGVMTILAFIICSIQIN